MSSRWTARFGLEPPLPVLFVLLAKPFFTTITELRRQLDDGTITAEHEPGIRAAHKLVICYNDLCSRSSSLSVFDKDLLSSACLSTYLEVAHHCSLPNRFISFRCRIGDNATGCFGLKLVWVSNFSFHINSRWLGNANQPVWCGKVDPIKCWFSHSWHAASG